MLRGLFPRLFGQFREGGIVVCQFVASNTGATFTATANSRVGATFTGSAGQYVLSLGQGVLNMVVVGAHVSCPDEDDLDDFHALIVNQEDGGVIASSGLAYFTSVDYDATPAITAIEDTSIVTVVLYVNK